MPSDVVVLKRQLGLWSCVGLAVGSIIGSGIFISPKGILANTGESVGWALVVWIACGVISMLGALCMAELATTFPRSGGDFMYIMLGFNKLLAFLRVFSYVLVIRPAVTAVVSMTMSTYILAPLFPDCIVPDMAVKLLAALLLCLIFAMNIYSAPWSSRFQVVVTIAKVLGLSMIILMGFHRLLQGHTEHFENAFDDSKLEPTHIPLAFYSGLFAFAGWHYLPQVTEEVEKPARNIPLSIIISMIIVTVIYILTNVAYFTVLSPEQLLDSKAVASDFALPILGSWAWLIQLLVALSCLGALNGVLFSTSRVIFSASREGMFPEIFAMIHIKWLSPLPAALLLLPLCLSMFTSNNVYTLISYLSVSRWLFLAITAAVIPYHRIRYPDHPRPFKVPLAVSIIFVCCVLSIVVTGFFKDLMACIMGLIIVFIGVPVYFIFVVWFYQKKPDTFTRTTGKVTDLLQKLLLVIHQEEEEKTVLVVEDIY